MKNELQEKDYLQYTPLCDLLIRIKQLSDIEV